MKLNVYRIRYALESEHVTVPATDETKEQTARRTTDQTIILVAAKNERHAMELVEGQVKTEEVKHIHFAGSDLVASDVYVPEVVIPDPVEAEEVEAEEEEPTDITEGRTGQATPEQIGAGTAADTQQ